jgi:hypothetical protein
MPRAEASESFGANVSATHFILLHDFMIYCLRAGVRRRHQHDGRVQRVVANRKRWLLFGIWRYAVQQLSFIHVGCLHKRKHCTLALVR